MKKVQIALFSFVFLLAYPPLQPGASLKLPTRQFLKGQPPLWFNEL